MDVTLVMFHSDGKRRDIAIKQDTTVLGRSEEADLQIPLATVSRKHAEVILDELDGTVRLRDRGSSNGTFVNDQRVTETELAAGDVIKIGPVVFTVQIDGEPAEIVGTATVLPADDAGDVLEHYEETVDTGDTGDEGEEILSLDGLPREGGAQEEVGLEDLAKARKQRTEDDGLSLAEDEGLPLAEEHEAEARDEVAEEAVAEEAVAEEEEMAVPSGEAEEVVEMPEEEVEEAEEEEEPEPAVDPLAALAAMAKSKRK